MDLNVLLWILGGGFAGTWGLCIFFMNRSDNAVQQMKSEVRQDISEIRKEVSQLFHCVKDHHGRLCVLEQTTKKDAL